ncbi:MAG: mechanosensitive ion channel [Proteobacteria bacterium]|nr:mechanosensitive ion channel [Pseudomonadota bacterium]
MESLLHNVLFLRVAFAISSLLISLAAGFFLRWLCRHYLPKLLQEVEWKGKDIFFQTIHPWIIPLVLLPGLSFAAKSLNLPGFLDRLLIALAILFFTILFANLASRLAQFYSDRTPTAIPFSGLTRNLARISILVIGIITMLNQLGVSITPLLTTLGIGGLAVALALQETLSNLFAGLFMTIGGQIRVGDQIKLQSGEEGQVVDTDWRSTRIRNQQNNLIIIPNAKLSQTIITKILPPQT